MLVLGVVRGENSIEKLASRQFPLLVITFHRDQKAFRALDCMTQLIKSHDLLEEGELGNLAPGRMAFCLSEICIDFAVVLIHPQGVPRMHRYIIYIKCCLQQSLNNKKKPPEDCGNSQYQN